METNLYPVIEWAYQNRSNLQLKVTELTWAKTHGWTDFKAQLKWDGHSVEGHGCAQNPKLALTKAIAEAMERAITTEITCYSSAIHIDPENAKQNCLYEYTERTLLYRHLDLKDPVDQIYIDSNDNIQYFKLGGPSLKTHTILAAKKCLQGHALGCKTHSNYHLAIAGAKIECQKQFSDVEEKSDKYAPHTLSTFNISPKTPIDRQRLGLGSDFKLPQMLHATRQRQEMAILNPDIFVFAVKNSPFYFSYSLTKNSKTIFFG